MTPGPSDMNESGLRESGNIVRLNDVRPRRPTSDISVFLRHGTQKLIDSRNAHIDALDLGDIGGYRAFLACEAEALLPLEAALVRGGIENLVPDWPRRARSASVSRDLLALGIACDPLPVPPLRSPAEMLGACYALEATRMGSRLALAKLVEASADDASMAATSFLRHGLGQRFWPSFLETLERHHAAADHPGHVLHAAQMALGMFESARGPSLHPAGAA